MTGRVIAWVLFLAVCYGVTVGARAFSNPWSAALTSPVLSHLPLAADGCAKKAC
jgi:hypothetical protein